MIMMRCVDVAMHAPLTITHFFPRFKATRNFLTFSEENKLSRHKKVEEGCFSGWVGVCLFFLHLLV